MIRVDIEAWPPGHWPQGASAAKGRGFLSQAADPIALAAPLACLFVTLVRVRRVYEPPSAEDGLRLLVDRLWPRGMSRERAALAAWVREVAPSVELRRWYAHAPEREAEFRERYSVELSEGEPAAALAALDEIVSGAERVTLLTATSDIARSNARVLAEILIQSGRDRHLDVGDEPGP